MDILLQQGASPAKRKNWRTMTEVERYQQVEDILVRHRRFNMLWEELDFCSHYGRAVKTAEPPCLAILGETGAGKSTLKDTWIAQKPRQETPEGSQIPYLSTLIPAKATVISAASAFLRDLGDPNPDRGTEGRLVGRLHHLIKVCQVQMIFIDEVQHLMDKTTDRILHHVSDFLKNILLETHIPVVLIGRQGGAEPALEADNQLARRIGSPLIFEPFAWDRTKEGSILEFRLILQQIDEALPLDPSGLTEESIACRFYFATRGYLGWIMQVIRKAAYLAIKRKCSRLHLPLLAEAYEARIAGTEFGLGMTNPFQNPFIEAQAQEILERAKKTDQIKQKGVSKRGNRKGASTP